MVSFPQELHMLSVVSGAREAPVGSVVSLFVFYTLSGSEWNLSNFFRHDLQVFSAQVFYLSWMERQVLVAVGRMPAEEESVRREPLDQVRLGPQQRQAPQTGLDFSHFDFDEKWIEAGIILI